ncbi:MAG: cupin domain-containing protein [Candidatus Hydrothermarchaeota archaeon]
MVIGLRGDTLITKGISQVDGVEVGKGVKRRVFVSSEHLMLVHFELEEGSEIPMHEHFHEQAGFLIKGRIRIITGEKEILLREGESYLIPSNEKHVVFALEYSQVLDVFFPPRKDFL